MGLRASYSARRRARECASSTSAARRRWRCPRRIIAAVDLGPRALFHQQRHRRLEKVDAEAYRLVQLGELMVGPFALEAVVAHELAHD